MPAPSSSTTSDSVLTLDLEAGPAAAEGARGPPASLATTLTELSAVISHLHALGQRHPSHHRLRDRLDPAAAGFEALIHVLLVTADTDPTEETTLTVDRSPRPVPRRAPTRSEAVFLSWLAGPASDRLLLSDRDAPVSAMTRLLASLSGSRRVLPPKTAAAFGLPVRASLGQAVTGLLLAVTGPAGLGGDPFGSGVRLTLDQNDGFATRHGPR
jgi:hypothetical protein